MDDGILLNLATDNGTNSHHLSARKGGRWTDRLKAKRVAKRKSRSGDQSLVEPSSAQNESPHPTKKARIELKDRTPARAGPTTSSRPTQVISSLFSYNPKIEKPAQNLKPISCAHPSNAPLDSSSFSGLGLDSLLVSHLATKMNITKPTSIQRSALHALISTDSAPNGQRDVFVQSQTGSGKTLSYLLPLIQDLLPLSSLSYIDRSIGTLAIIVAPTRELAKQIADVAENLLHLRLRPRSESTDDQDGQSTRLTRWLVSGLLTGGATRSHEKARLRKGIPILVSTPGRLLDHLQHTSSFNVAKCRWLVLDEADRLMDLGFEETIHGIINGLEGRRRLALTALEEGKSTEVGGWDWERRRRTVLCSATIEENVQKLAGTALVNPLMVKASETDKPLPKDSLPATNQSSATLASEKFTPPSQLAQKYIVVPLKLRLVALVALLRSLIAQSPNRQGAKIIVFFSCTDSVDFHWRLFGESIMNNFEEISGHIRTTDSDSESDKSQWEKDFSKTEVRSPLLPDTQIYRLHGSLPTSIRLASLHRFSGNSISGQKSVSTSSSVLFCTSVASRGLDLPLVRAVIQYDLPTEGGVTEYVHRIGRTARVGKGGEAWSLVAPSETKWVEWVEGKMRGQQKSIIPSDNNKGDLIGIGVEDILESGFGGTNNEYEERATETQLAFERWVLRKKENAECARKAYLSHMRAYATHPANEKYIFHIRHLHLGHLAKSFALREAPSTVTHSKGSLTSKYETKSKTKARKTGSHNGAEERMQATVRAQGRLTKRGGVMMNSGSSEFQIASGDALEKLVQGSRFKT